MKNKILLLLISVLLLITGCNSKSETPNTNTDTQTDPEQVTITNIKTYPSGEYTAYSGEKIDLKVEATFSNGETKDITDKTLFSSSNENFAILDNNTVVISDTTLTADSLTITLDYENFSEKVVFKIKNSLEKNIDENGIITNPTSYDAVMNKTRGLPSDYIPEDLVNLTVETCLANPEVNQLRQVASDALTKLFAAAKSEKEFDLVARSGYRSYNTQTGLYNSYVRKHGQESADKFSAKPGLSEHQTGLAIDITSENVSYQLSDSFGETEEGIWVKNNAHKFGFIIRYPKDKEEITGYIYEPWHLRYIGVTLATEIYQQGLTLEEYFINN